MLPKLMTGIVALAFFGAGSLKLFGVPLLHESFSELGLPSWFGYFIGIAEVAGAIGLLVRKLFTPAALGLIVIMLGAVHYHLTLDTFFGSVPAFTLLLLLVLILIFRRAEPTEVKI